MARLPKARHTRKSKIHSVNITKAVLRLKRKERSPTDAEKTLQAPIVQPPESAKKSRTGFFRGLLSCAKYALPLIFSAYLAAFAVTWAQYEFAFNRQRQQLSIIGAMMAAGKAKDFAPLLAELTQRKLPVRPTLWDWEYIALTVSDNQEPERFSNYNQALMDDVAGLVRRVDSWEEADLSWIVLSKVNLERAKLSGAELIEANLTGANLGGANLKEAHLHEAKLSGADLRDADLRDADLTRANLTAANLFMANLKEANLGGANLTDANLGGANLTGAYLFDANLTKADLGGANLTDANLGGGNLTGASLFRANLTGANLAGASLTEAELSWAELTGTSLFRANLTGANLRGADLNAANLTDADLTRANLTRADLSQIHFYNTTVTVLIDDTYTANDIITEAVETLAKAKTLYQAKLPKPVRERLEKSHPHLFEEPKE